MTAISLDYTGICTGYLSFWRACVLPGYDTAVWVRCSPPVAFDNVSKFWTRTEAEKVAKTRRCKFYESIWEGKEVESLSPIELLSLPSYNSVLSSTRYSQ